MKETVEIPELHKILISFLPTLRRLVAREEKLNNELRDKLPWHPLAELKSSLPRGKKIFRLSLLVVFLAMPEELPWNVRLQIEEWKNSNKVSGDDLIHIKELLRNPRWVAGRLPQVLEKALAGTQLWISLEPPRAKRRVRRRGHRESSQVSLVELPESFARRAAAESRFDELSKEDQIRESQRVQLARADLILKKEALGEPIPPASDWNTDRSFEEQKFSEAFWPTEPQEILVYGSDETSKDSENTSNEEKDVSPCESCKYGPRGSIWCAAGSLACDGGQKPF